MLHRLNALRVCGEFLVVHAHYYSGIYADAHGYNPAGLWEGSDVMSFFFVLSGFVAMYSNMDNDDHLRHSGVSPVAQTGQHSRNSGQ